MSTRLEQLGLTDVEVALVTFSSPEELDEYQLKRGHSCSVLTDPDRVAYRSYGLGRGSLRDVWGFKTLRRYAQILRPGGSGSRHDLGTATGDTRQLGGDFVIDAEGRLAWGHWGAGPADRPDVDDLVTAVQAALDAANEQQR